MGAHAITLVREQDLGDLLPLLRGYCDFYEVDPPDEQLLAMCRALIADPGREGLQLIARGPDGAALGFATVFWTWQTLDAGRIGVMNDLFVHPDARGTRARRGADRGLRRPHARPRRQGARVGDGARQRARADRLRPRRRHREPLAHLRAGAVAGQPPAEPSSSTQPEKYAPAGDARYATRSASAASGRDVARAHRDDAHAEPRPFDRGGAGEVLQRRAGRGPRARRRAAAARPAARARCPAGSSLAVSTARVAFQAPATAPASAVAVVRAVAQRRGRCRRRARRRPAAPARRRPAPPRPAGRRPGSCTTAPSSRAARPPQGFQRPRRRRSTPSSRPESSERGRVGRRHARQRTAQLLAAPMVH